jgi:predicted site-specific integrase-resolvase
LPIEIDGKNYYWMLDVCRQARVSRSTLLRWLKQGVIREPLRDRRGYRIFSEAEAAEIRGEVERTCGSSASEENIER